MRYDEGSWQYQAARAQLKHDEHLLWVGGPDPLASALVRWGSFVWGLIFTSPFIAAAIAFVRAAAPNTWQWLTSPGTWQNVKSPQDWQAAIAGLSVFGFFFLLLASPFIYAALRGLSSPLRAFLQARATVYAVTDHRFVFLSGRQRPRAESFAADTIPIVHRFPHGSRVNLVFPGAALSKQVAKFNGGHKSTYQPLGLYQLTEAEAAEQALLRMRSYAPTTGARPSGSALGHQLTMPWPKSSEGTRLAPDEALKAMLMADETIQWQERPRLTNPMTAPAMVLLGVVLCCFAGFGYSTVPTSGLSAGRLFVEFVLAIPFLGGLALLAAPRWVPERLERIRYAVTNRRLLVMEPRIGGRMSLASYIPPNLYIAGELPISDGGGTITVRLSDEITTYRVRDERTGLTSTRTRVAPGSFLQGLPDLRAARAALETLRDGTLLQQPVMLQSTVVAAVPQAPLAMALQAIERPAEFPAELLQPGEELRWVGRPTVRVTIPHVLMALFGIGFLLPAAFAILGDIFQGHFFAIVEVLSEWPMVLFGLAVGTYPWLYQLAAHGTIYAVTNQRALVLTGGVGGRKLRVFPTSMLKTRASVSRGNGGGDLTFNPDAMPVMQPVAIAGPSGELSTQSIPSLLAALTELLPFSKGFIAVHSLAEAESAIARLLEEPTEQLA